MTVAFAKAARDDLAVLFAAGATGSVSDAELLASFSSGRGDASSDAAFTALVDRHGPMVLGLCRRVTGDPHSAEDAFQAVFLILARKAHAVRLAADDSLARWLFGVSLRVSRRAAALGVRRPLAARSLDGLEPIDHSSPSRACELADLRTAIDSEIARLPVHYRSVVVLCHLEGLSQKQAARRLRCPLGTVESRLCRARERLRSGLARRGLAPTVAALLAALEVTSQAALPSHLAKATVASATKLSRGAVLTARMPAAVARLAEYTLYRMMIKQYLPIAGLIALGLATASGVVALAPRVGREPKAKPPAENPQPAVKAAADRSEHTLGKQLDDLKAEFERADRAFFAFYRGSTIPPENLAQATKLKPDFPAFVRTIGSLAASAPSSPAVRDAMLWVIGKSQDFGPYTGEFALAANWLVRYFGDDPEAIRVGLDLDNWPNPYRDNLLLTFYASAKSRESKGLARLALAQYLETKATLAERAKKVEGRPTLTHDDLVRADGTRYSEKELQPDDDFAYLLHLKQCDVSYLRAEAERLYEEVIAVYADVPYITARVRVLEALLKQPEPKPNNGEPLTSDGRRRIATILARRSTLGQAAEDRLDDWHNLSVGKSAPEIRGVDVYGKPLALSNYRGKVVALVFWGTWCGPCMREIPREKALLERMKGRPFALLGVDADAQAEIARKVMDAQGVTWPNWHDDQPGDGPIAKLYHVRGYPTIYVIDAHGKIRSKGALGNELDQLVEKLVADQEAANK